jgi:hypothetical protein
MFYIDKVYSRHKWTRQQVERKLETNKVSNFTNLPRNVVAEKQETTIELSTDHLGYEFLSYVSQRNPTYKFYVETVHSPARGRCVNSILVFDEGECVGSIERQDTYTYGFFNDRISNDIRRGECKRTSKLSTAKNIFTTYFYKMTLMESMQVVQGAVKEALREKTWNSERTYQSLVEGLQKFVTKQLKDQDPVLIDYLELSGQKKLLGEYADVREAKEEHKQLQQQLQDKKGFYVYMADDEYRLWDEERPAVKRLKRTELSRPILTALGLLKVADKLTVINNVGFKVNDKTFFILKEVTLDFDN